MAELRDECAKFGLIMNLKVPRPTDVNAHMSGTAGGLVEASAVGKCFIEYSDTRGSGNAAKHLRGRSFGTATVAVDFFDELDFAAGVLK